MTSEWRAGDFSRRHYTTEGEALDKARSIRLIVEIDGKRFVQVQAREPGILAFVSRPDQQGFDLEIVEAKGIKFSDIRTIDGNATEALAPWMLEALGLA